MCTLKINTKCKKYKKADNCTKRSINSALIRLSLKLSASGKDVNEIYNNDSIVYDRINQDIFIYKAHGESNIQLRIVYAYTKVHSLDVLYLIDYAVKKKNDKRYLSEMNVKFRNVRLSDIEFEELHCKER